MSTSGNQVSPQAATLPAQRAGLVIRPIGKEGRHVVKDPDRGDYFELGKEEHFLLTQLNGQRDAQAVCSAFNEQFGESLSEEDLDSFLRVAREQGLLEDAPRAAQQGEKAAVAAIPQSAIHNPKSKQSILYWRKDLFDPDRFFTWLAPQLRFCWTRGFLILSASCIILAAMLVWANRPELAQSFSYALRWETAFWAWLVLFLVTMLHESAHGLTCKHHGGEVHEIGFLLLFFMPCFYCNVSDAWLFKERSKRLWVTFAGGFFELFLWAWAVFAWRLTLPGTLPNYLAFVVLSACGVGTLFNFNPLLKLDGYYLLSDWLEIPNLQQRAVGYFKGQFRRLLWGAPRPEPQAHGRLLLGFGLATWVYSLLFVGLMLAALWSYAVAQWGLLGIVGVVVLGLTTTKGLFQGVTAGEVNKMIAQRRKRSMLWLLAAGAVASILCFVRVEDRARGTFELRSVQRVELRAPVPGFVEAVHFDQGDQVSTGALVVRLVIPELADCLKQKLAERREAHARLQLLEIGPRPEQVAEQRRRVARATSWRDLAQHDLDCARQALQADLTRLEQQIAECRAERDAAEDVYRRSCTLHEKAAISEEHLRDAQRKKLVAEAQAEQAIAQRRAQLARGTLAEEAELAKRHKELADTQGELLLLEAGTRPKELEAQQALLARVEAEVLQLEQRFDRTRIHAPLAGTITTPRLKEKAGHYVQEGDLICLIEEPAYLEAEVSLAEQGAARVRRGQRVALTARILPSEKLSAQVERVAPFAEPDDVQGKLTVYCSLEGHARELKPGMTGVARIDTGARPVGAILLDRLLRSLRTEFWW